MSIYSFVFSGLWVDIFFEKEGTTEQWGTDFEIETPASHLYWELKKNLCRASFIFNFLIFGDKQRTAFKSSMDLYFHPLIIEFF